MFSPELLSLFAWTDDGDGGNIVGIQQGFEIRISRFSFLLFILLVSGSHPHKNSLSHNSVVAFSSDVRALK